MNTMRVRWIELASFLGQVLIRKPEKVTSPLRDGIPNFQNPKAVRGLRRTYLGVLVVTMLLSVMMGFQGVLLGLIFAVAYTIILPLGVITGLWVLFRLHVVELEPIAAKDDSKGEGDGI